MDSTELRDHGYHNVHQAIMATHPDWLRAVGGSNSIPATGKNAPAPVVGVFVDGSRRPQDVDYLKSLLPEDVRVIRRLSNSESAVNYGSEWAWGAIVITLAR